MTNQLDSPKTIYPEPKEGVVEQEVSQSQRGRVKFEGTSWPAKLYDSNCETILEPNQMVQVIGIDRITLLVMPVNEKITRKPDLEESATDNIEENSKAATLSQPQAENIMEID